METKIIFSPPRRKGLLVHITAALLMLGSGGICFWQALQSADGSTFIFLLMLSIVLLVPVPLLVYRAYALAHGSYRMDRDGLQLRWGLRAEDIPLPEVEWVRPAAEMGFRLPLPFWSIPGAILGTRNVDGLGLVEFMASEVKSMLLVATPQKVFAISPGDLKGFERSFYRIIELGSLTPLSPISVQPAAFAQRIWKDRVARILTAAGLGMTVLLFLVSAVLISSRNSISLGFDANLKPFDPGPPERLLLLPVMGGIVFVIDVLVGMFFYRREQQRLVAYLMWVCSILMPLLLLVGLAFI
jgi:hypothetical protein